MTNHTYTVRRSLFAKERSIVTDDDGIVVRDGDEPERRIAWVAIDAVHVQSTSRGDENQTLWHVKLVVKDGAPIRIDSLNVRGIGDFEDKTPEFASVLTAIHVALMPRATEVRFLYGMGSGLILTWRFMLVLCIIKTPYRVAGHTD